MKEQLTDLINRSKESEQQAAAELQRVNKLREVHLLIRNRATYLQEALETLDALLEET